MAMAAALGGALVGTGPWAAAETPAEIDAIVARLGSEDPDERRQAAEQIGALGVEAREALSRAAESEDPAVARAARSLLANLPWHAADDPADVRRHLESYANASMDERRVLIRRFSEMGTPAAKTALLRILLQEPRPTLRWQVAGLVIQHRSLLLPEPLREMDAAGNAPALVASAWAWRETDPARAEALLESAMKLEAAAPSDDQNMLFRPWRWLYLKKLGRQEIEAAAELCRVAAARHAALNPDGESWAVRELLMLHARFGPLPGLEADLARHAPRLRQAVDLYLVAQCLRATGQAMLAGPIEHAAFLQGANRPAARLQTAWTLMQSAWIELAERELQAMLDEHSLEEGVVMPLNEAYQATALTSLAYLAGQAGRDAESAARWERAIPPLRQFRDARLPGMAVEGDAATHAREQMLWRSMRAARARGDQAEVDKLVDELVRHSPTDADILYDLIPQLEQRGRQAEAQRLFDAAYSVVKVPLEQSPESAEAMNNLAWLNARAGMRLDEALKHASRAVELEPDNAAYIDTLAEVHYRLGQPHRSVELETRALRLRPGDRFMQAQLQRYQAAASTQPSGQ
jgi:tetratricopeptide (TPR) repeat protein